jgi:negative regulator of replication initiation
MDFISIEEARKKTGKSDATLRRLIKHVTKQPTMQSLVKKDEQGKWLISFKLLEQEYGLLGQVTDEPKQETKQEPSHEYAEPSQASNKFLEILQEQLREKDRQIADLNERLREAHLLNNSLQNRLLPAPVQQTDDTIEGGAETETRPAPKKRSIWERIWNG